MTGILDQVARNRGTFRVKSTEEFFGLQLATAVEDTERLGAYVKVAADYPATVLADAAKRFLDASPGRTPVYERFLHELTHGAYRGSGKPPEVVACKVERTLIALAVLDGRRLVRTEVRHLRSGDDDAHRSAAGLIRRLSEDNPEASYALEVCEDKATRRTRLTQTVIETARAIGLPLWTVGPEELLASFAVPPCRTREDMRAIVLALFPDLLAGITIPAEIDAVAIGLLTNARILLHTDKDASDRKEAA